MKINFNILVLFFVFNNCTGQFNSDNWKNASSAIESRENIRKNMVQDLMDNHLKESMTKEQILEMLGTPNNSSTENRVDRKVAKTLPDSLSAKKIVKLPKQDQANRIEELAKWRKAHAETMDLFIYNIGWAEMDPVFLYVRFEDSKVIDYWTGK
ncbi:hypothetical protein [Gilvibacter sp.]|uniref:hypothetical protein n=1 Tax=Gilvibacter sp. TaxID=2729997 RepID=UPI0035BE2AC8